MPGERYVVLGLAQIRSPWFRDVSRWATSSSLPVEFVKAMSLEEVRTRLSSGRGYSALLIDDTVPGLDLDLTERARSVGCSVIVVDRGRTAGRWAQLGASAALPPQFDRSELLQVLSQVATPVAGRDAGALRADAPGPSGHRGHLVAVTGGGGCGRSTVAMAVAQGLATDAQLSGMVCLADLVLDAEQAMLHGAADVVPGVLELIDAHRSGAPTIDTVRSLTWEVDRRGYHLLLGLRRHRDWTGLRPASVHAAIDGLRRAFRCTVADVDGDLEGEQVTGSADIEDRNAMARATISAASLVLVVGTPGMKGVHTLLRVTRDLLAHGVPGHRIVPVVNQAPRGPRVRAELTQAFGALLAGSVGSTGVPAPVFLAPRRGLDAVLRDGARLPDQWLGAVVSPVRALLGHAEPPHLSEDLEEAPVPILPGSLGHWPDAPETLEVGEP